jgi:hypothetical protein
MREQRSKDSNGTSKILRTYMKSGSPGNLKFELTILNQLLSENGKNRGGTSIFKANGEDSERRVEESSRRSVQ